jgi:hypothetical protein
LPIWCKRVWLRLNSVRSLSRAVAEAYYASREELGYPLIREALIPKALIRKGGEDE